MQDSSDRFVVVDVETANPRLSSICQIGIASFRDGALQGSWESLVNPEDYFDPMNVSIHGIDEERVKSAPTWPVVYPQADRLLEGSVVVSHTHFDRSAVCRACEKYALMPSEYQWLDSARVVRHTWPIFARSGYGLSNVAEHFSIKYTEHDALEDARCAGEILLRAMAETGWNASEWLRRANEPITGSVIGSTNHGITRDGNPDGPLHGEVLVFTGTLSMPRTEAADAASASGCEVDSGVTQRTTLLVVGDQDIRTKLAGHDKSLKRRKAEELIAKGQRIRIIGETDFRHLCGFAVCQTKANRTALGRDANQNEKIESRGNKTRLSLTKSQTQAGAGAELLALCQSLTEKGSISDAEARELERWLSEHRSADLPSVVFLATVVEQTLTDSIITPEQSKALYRAIETVLPPEARKTAVVHRKAAELVEKERAQAALEAEKQHDREEKERNQPFVYANFKVAGVTHEGRSSLIEAYVHPGDKVFLIRDRHNKFSRNAVEIRLQNGYQIGFVPEADATEFAPLLDKGCLHHAFVTRILKGRRSPVPVVQAYFYRADSQAKDAVPETAVPQKRTPTHAGCLTVIAISLALVVPLVVAMRACI